MLRFRVRIAMAIGLVYAAVALSSLTPGAARADRRHLVWTYEPQTMKKGEAEIETYTTFSAADQSKREDNTSTQLQYELEIGMTDKFDVGIYQVFEQDPGKALAYAGYKIRLRHWLAKAAGFPLDVVGYAEYKGTPDLSGHAIETKLILGRDLGKLRFALNPILEIEKEEGGDGEDGEEGEWETKAEYAAGLTWMPSQLLSLGLEAKGNKDAHYLGPVIGHGLGGLWVAFGPVFRIAESGGEEGSGTDGESASTSPESQIRLLIGLNVRGHSEPGVDH